MPTLADVGRIAAPLPDSEERPSGGGPCWFVRRKPFAWQSMPWPSTADAVREIVAAETCLGVAVPSEDDKRALLQMLPGTILDAGTPWSATKVVIRLGAIPLDHLTELVTESWRTQAPQYLRREYDERT